MVATRSKKLPAGRRGAVTDKPFPLRKHFQRWIFPCLLAFAAILTVSVAFGSRGTIEDVYLALTQRRIAALATALNRGAPGEWQALLSAPTAAGFLATAPGQRLTQLISEEMRRPKELRSGTIKIYASDGRLLLNDQPDGVDLVADSDTVLKVYQGKKSILAETRDADGVAIFRLFVPLINNQNVVEAVFEIDEPSAYLNRVILQNVFPPIVISILFLAAMIGALFILVIRAQKHIDLRTEALVALRGQLESFVSRGTAAAAKKSVDLTTVSATRTVVTLLFADVRGFSGFAESTVPDVVAKFLNTVTDVITSVVRQYGGDIDKLMGDGALAHFEGAGKEGRAVSAAQTVLRQLVTLDLPRGVGIGIYDGEVIATVLGSHERKDFTVIGDSVNIAARLCDLAEEGQIVADCGALEQIENKFDGFGPVEEISVKGRVGQLKIRRWTISKVYRA